MLSDTSLDLTCQACQWQKQAVHFDADAFPMEVNLHLAVAGYSVLAEY